ncbi:MAG: P-II family nitrogen regulator [Methanoregula sp.]|jgi:nitrogen regulatory protein PII
MKMIWAVIRSDAVQSAIESLRKLGIKGITRMNVLDGTVPTAGPAGVEPVPDESSREMLMVVLADHEVGKAVSAIRAASKLCGNDKPVLPGRASGKILITYVEEFFTIRPSRKGSGPVHNIP